MKILTIFFLFVLFFPNVHSQELNQKTIIPYLDNLIKSEREIYNYEMKKGKFKLYPLYKTDFLTQKKFDPPADFLIQNFNLVIKNKGLKKKYIDAIQNSNFHFGLYLFNKAYESNQIDLIKLSKLYYQSNKLIRGAAYFFSNPKNRSSDFNFRDYFLIFNYTLAPASHWLSLPPPSGSKITFRRFYRGQHIHYNELNRTKMRKGGLRWKVKVDTVKALKKLKPFKGRVYSGLKTNPNLDKKIGKNDILCFGGFLSTSNQKNVAQEFRNKARSKFLFQIESKSGKDINKISEHFHESEILFYPYKKFKLINIYEEPKEDNFGDFGGFGGPEDTDLGNIKIIHLEEIKDHKGPCKSLTKGNRIRPRGYFGD